MTRDIAAEHAFVLSPEQQQTRDLIIACKNAIRHDATVGAAFRRMLTTPHANLAHASTSQSEQDTQTKSARARLYLYTLVRGLPLERIGGIDPTLACKGHESDGHGGVMGCGKPHWNAAYYLNKAWTDTVAALPEDRYPKGSTVTKPQGADFLA